MLTFQKDSSLLQILDFSLFPIYNSKYQVWRKQYTYLASRQGF